ncbi:MAG: hypothetical protein ACW963_00460 [Candidatus Sifarchaeia archaeon]|jgi:exosome complex RNA-binding protein Rrp4
MKVKEQINSGDLVIPGDVLGVIEEFIADSGTYEEDGLILASIVGNVNVDARTKKISVIAKNKPITPVKGSIVFGKVSDAKKQLVDLMIGKMDSKELNTPVTGTLHISCVSERLSDWRYRKSTHCRRHKIPMLLINCWTRIWCYISKMYEVWGVLKKKRTINIEMHGLREY